MAAAEVHVAEEVEEVEEVVAARDKNDQEQTLSQSLSLMVANLSTMHPTISHRTYID